MKKVHQWSAVRFYRGERFRHSFSVAPLPSATNVLAMLVLPALIDALFAMHRRANCWLRRAYYRSFGAVERGSVGLTTAYVHLKTCTF